MCCVELPVLSAELLRQCTSYQFSVSNTGTHTITATVNDKDSTLAPCTCRAEVRVVEGIAVYGDYASDLRSKLETRISDKQFFAISTLSSLDSYTALIVNLAGSGYGLARGNLTSSEAVLPEYRNPFMKTSSRFSGTAGLNTGEEKSSMNHKNLL